MKKLLILSLVLISSLNLFAKRSFNCDVLMSLQSDSMDWWYFLPENSKPFVQSLKTCYRHENLNFYLFFKFLEEMPEKSFEYEVFVIGKDGMEDIALEKTKFEYDSSQINSILPLPKQVRYKFGYKAELGNYDVVLRIVFENEIFDFVKTIELKEWEYPAPIANAKEATSLIFSYAQSPNTQKLFSMFCSNSISLLKKGAPNDLDYLFLSFFKHTFNAQAFLYDKLLILYPNADEALQKKILILFAYANKDFQPAVFKNKDDKDVYYYLSQSKIPDPYGELKGSYAPAQLDVLWGEFYATASFRAFLKIIATLEYTEQGAFAEKIVREKSPPKNKQAQDDFAIGMTYLNTLKRITLSTENPLFLKYLYKLIESKTLSNSIAVQLAILVRTANENAKPQKEPEIINIGNLENLNKELAP